MSAYRIAIAIALLGLISADRAWAEKGYLVISVRDYADAPMPLIQIGTRGVGAAAVSDNLGRARLYLGPGAAVGQIVTLQIVPPPLNLVLIAPAQGRTPIPSFDDENDNYITATVVGRGDARMLESAAVLADAAKISVPSLSTKPRPPARRKSGELEPLVPLIRISDENEDPAQPSGLGLISEEVASELGFSRDQIESAMGRFNDDPITWKVVLMTAQMEFGNHNPFSSSIYLNGELKYGISGAGTQSGGLQTLLGQMRASNPDRFDEIMGDRRGIIPKLIGAKVTDAINNVLKSLTDPRMSNGVRSEWAVRFQRLGSIPAFQRVQFQQLQPLVTYARKLAADLTIRSERGLALVYDTIYERGRFRTAEMLGEIEEFTTQIGRPPDEQEKLLIFANLSLGRGTNPIFREYFRARQLAFATGRGVVAGLDIDLDASGLGLFDMDTGAPIPTQDDAATTERLRAGWLPAALANRPETWPPTKIPT